MILPLTRHKNLGKSLNLSKLVASGQKTGQHYMASLFNFLQSSNTPVFLTQTTWLWTEQVHMYVGFFFQKVYSQPFISPCFMTMDSMNCWLKTVFLICVWVSASVQGRLCALFYAILRKALEHAQIFVFPGVLNPVPCRYQWPATVKFWGSRKLYMDFILVKVNVLNPHVVLGLPIFCSILGDALDILTLIIVFLQ